MPTQPTTYLTPEEVSKQMKVSPETVVRRFEGRRGVIDLGFPETRFKRRYRLIRIPQYALDQYIHELELKAA